MQKASTPQILRAPMGAPVGMPVGVPMGVQVAAPVSARLSWVCRAGILSVVALLCACHSLGETPSAGSVAMAGTWTLDRAHSDDAAKIVAARLARMKPPRRREMRLGPGDVPPLENPDDQPEGAGSDGGPEGGPGPGPEGGPGGRGAGPSLYQRLRGDSVQMYLDAPDTVEWQFDGESVRLKINGEPVRVLDAGQKSARFDSSGAMTVYAGWDAAVFVVDSRYVNGERRTERYSLDRDGATLHVERSASGTMLGSLTARSVYRRAAR